MNVKEAIERIKKLAKYCKNNSTRESGGNCNETWGLDYEALIYIIELVNKLLDKRINDPLPLKSCTKQFMNVKSCPTCDELIIINNKPEKCSACNQIFDWNDDDV